MSTATDLDLVTTIGLEIHVELLTKSKMFCGCPVAFGGEPNTRVCPVCLGHPGTLPVANRKAVEYTAKIGLALESEIAAFTQFHRKNYFYPDMPKDYQISQFDSPICKGGHLDVEMDDYTAKIGITRVHLEEDTGKMLHASSTGRIADAGYSLVDFNRAGTPLAEIVTEPDISSPAEARAFAQQLRNILVQIGVSDCNMEEGSLRVDANVSLRPAGQKEWGAKAEVKNMNSFRALQKALEYEVERQKKLILAGERVVQETRHWDADRNMTSSLRSKEEAHDYRYFTDPDLVPFGVGPAWVAEIQATMPELPARRKERLISAYELPAHDAGTLSNNAPLGDYFEETLKVFAEPKLVSNWVLGEFSAQLNAAGTEVEEAKISPAELGALLGFVKEGKISGKMAKEIFAEMFASGRRAADVIEEGGHAQMSDSSAVESLIDEVLAAHPGPVAEYLAGKTQTFGFLVGQVMKASKGTANPAMANKLLKEKLAARAIATNP